jgi:CHAT domain-containing protein
MKKMFLSIVFIAFSGSFNLISAQTAKEMVKILDSLNVLGQYKNCLLLADSYLEICRKELGDTSYSYSTAMLRKGVYKAASGDYDGWEAFMSEIKTQVERTKATEKQLKFLKMRYAHVGGSFAFKLGNYPQAEIWFYEKWQASKEYFGEYENETIGAYINYGSTFVRQEKLLKAKQILEAALKMFEKNPKPDKNAMGICYRNLGVIAHEVGDFETFEANAQKGFDLQMSLGRKSEALMDQKAILDGMVRRGENFAEIRHLYDELAAGTILEYGEKSVQYATILCTIASFLADDGLLREAKNQFDLAQKVFEEQGADVTSTDDYFYLLENYQALNGNLHEKKKQILQLEQLATLKKIREADDWHETLVVLANLVVAYWEDGRMGESNQLLKQIENHKNFEKLEFEDSFELEYMLFKAYFLRENWQKAESYLTKFGEVAATSFGKGSTFWSTFLKEKYEFHKKTDQNTEYLAALATYGDCLQQRQQAQILSWTDRERALFSNVWSDYTNELVAAKNQKIGKSLPISDVYQQVLMKKSALSNLNSRLKTAIFTNDDAETIEIYKNWTEAKEKIAHLKTLAPEKIFIYGYNLDSIQRETDRFELKLATKSKSFQNFIPLAQPNWVEIQQILPKNSASIDLIKIKNEPNKNSKTQTQYAIFILKPDAKEPNLLFLENGNDLDLLFYEQYAADIKAGKTPSAEIYDAFWGKIEPFLVGVETIYFAPDGIFHKINIGTLQRSDGRFLSDVYQIRNVQSVGELLNRTASDDQNQGAKTAVLVGNPRFDLDKNSEQTGSSGMNWRSMLDADASGRPFALAPLPASEREVIEIANLLKINGFETETLLDTAATEVNLKLKKSPTVVHLATHGHFLKSPKREKTVFDEQETTDNPMLRAMLFFSGASNTLNQQSVSEKFGDGIFTAYEATNLSLEKTELVVLSACDSGLGQIENGEGVFGLQRAFRYAGARFVLMSLWEVEDSATEKFMTVFYKNWMGGKPIPDAFSAAQKEMQRLGFKPVDWGGWVLLGN